jgi:hypothetical protein
MSNTPIHVSKISSLGSFSPRPRASRFGRGSRPCRSWSGTLRRRPPPAAGPGLRSPGPQRRPDSDNGFVLTCRVGVELDATVGASPGDSTRATAQPAVEAWLANARPTPARHHRVPCGLDGCRRPRPASHGHHGQPRVGGDRPAALGRKNLRIAPSPDRELRCSVIEAHHGNRCHSSVRPHQSDMPSQCCSKMIHRTRCSDFIWANAATTNTWSARGSYLARYMRAARPLPHVPVTASPRSRVSLMITFSFASTRSCDCAHCWCHRRPASGARGHGRGRPDRGRLVEQQSAQPGSGLGRDDQRRLLWRHCEVLVKGISENLLPTAQG